MGKVVMCSTKLFVKFAPKIDIKEGTLKLVLSIIRYDNCVAFHFLISIILNILSDLTD